MTDWTTLAAALADELTAAGKLCSPQWQAAVRAVPRHELVPVHYTMDPYTGTWTAAETADDLARVYSNTALYILPGGLSSTSMPSLMTRMLETLDVQDGHRVLEIGAGSGYNIALLCHRLGGEHVFAVDIEADLIELARKRLTALGYHPTLKAADGMHGLPEHAPYDRVMATCSVPAVPWAWVQQTKNGGLILADVKIGRHAGNLVLLRRDGEKAEGRFDPTYGSFMGIRRRNQSYQPGPAGSWHREAAHQRSTTLSLTRPWEHPAFWFYAHTALPPGTSFSLRGEHADQPPANTVLHSPDGSWCEVREDPEDTDTRRVWEAGPHALWRIIEDTHAAWKRLGHPEWGRFGLTATPSHQRIWLDTPDGEHTWALGRDRITARTLPADAKNGTSAGDAERSRPAQPGVRVQR
ncbi:MAG: methyltransferase domain-containing protein [Pseudonocardiales bacterium]